MLISVMLMTSGATNPGVPHRQYKYMGSLTKVANPKSARMTDSMSLNEVREVIILGLLEENILQLDIPMHDLF